MAAHFAASSPKKLAIHDAPPKFLDSVVYFAEDAVIQFLRY